MMRSTARTMRHLGGRLALACLPATLLPVAAVADRPDDIAAAFEGWMQAQGVDTGAVADNTILLERGYGQPADTAVPLASLSKSVTAACIAVLQSQGVLDLDAPVDLFLDVPQGSGTLPDFLSHTSGLGPDRTQGAPLHLADDRRPAHAEVALAALAAPRDAPGFAYNNENYAVLGAIIDAVAQVDYETDCRDMVLEPLGIETAALDPVWGPLGAWGGWSMSVADFARFAEDQFATGRNLGHGPETWPHADLGNGVSYVMGAFHRRADDRDLFWHIGLLCWDGQGDGAYFASYGDGLVVTVAFVGCPDVTALQSLDAVLFAATNG